MKQVSRMSNVRDLLVYSVSFILLFLPPVQMHGLWSSPRMAADGLLAFELASFLFAWWARIHLGRLWSGSIILRKGHHVVKSGPYRLVRHPIYTGFIAGAWSFALIIASPFALAGASILTAQMAWKAKREESFLRAELGAADYDAYARTTPMLVPFTKATGGMN